MHIQIHTDTTEELSSKDKSILRALLGESATDVTVDAAAEKPAPAAKKATAKKAAPAPKKEAPKPAEEPVKVPVEEPMEDASEDAGEPTLEDAGEPTLEDAVARATEVLGKGGSAKVKAALTDLGVKRVSELKGEDIAAFMSALA